MTQDKKNKVMIVDDNQDIVDMIKNGLENLDRSYEVTGATSGKECLQLLKNGNLPDLIILDIMMPEISGWEVFAKIKENKDWRSIPIVFITARADPSTKGFARIPSNDLIEKPFSIIDLKQRIEKILNR
jgi:CheY-like chemotaxis protein